MKRLTFLIATAAVTAAASSSPATGAEDEVPNEGFDTLLTTIGDDAFPAEWRQWSADPTVEAEGRFAFRYLGDPATLGYAGLDTLRVVTAVPEPAGLLVLASSLGVIGLMQRRERY